MLRTTATTIVDPAPSADSRIRLPKLTIPSFEGDITKWTPFWDSYESAIYHNTGLTAIDKFNYLRSAAREAVSGLMLTAANYTEAVEILTKCYSNKQAIILRHIENLMGLEPVTSNNTKALRHLYDMVESNVRSLKSLGVAAETYGSLLCPVLVKKLPNELRLIIERKLGDEEWKMETVTKELLLEI